jgi:predicted nucleotidyltransferase
MMSTKTRSKSKLKTQRWYHGADVPMSAIRRFAREIAERFQPEKIVLFGSYAYGKPHRDSDVDILVIMPCRNQLDQAVKISLAIDAPFTMDLKVRTPANLKWRLKEGELFHTEIMSKGIMLYEKGDSGMGRQGRRRLPSRRTPRSP